VPGQKCGHHSDCFLSKKCEAGVCACPAGQSGNWSMGLMKCVTCDDPAGKSPPYLINGIEPNIPVSISFFFRRLSQRWKFQCVRRYRLSGSTCDLGFIPQPLNLRFLTKYSPRKIDLKVDTFG